MISVSEKDWDSSTVTVRDLCLSGNISAPVDMNGNLWHSVFFHLDENYGGCTRGTPRQSHTWAESPSQHWFISASVFFYSVLIFQILLKVPLKILIWHLKQHLTLQDQQHKPEPPYAGSKEHLGSLKAPGNPPDLFAGSLKYQRSMLQSVWSCRAYLCMICQSHWSYFHRQAVKSRVQGPLQGPLKMKQRVSGWRQVADVELRSSATMKTLKTRRVNPPQSAGFITSC